MVLLELHKESYTADWKCAVLHLALDAIQLILFILNAPAKAGWDINSSRRVRFCKILIRSLFSRAPARAGPHGTGSSCCRVKPPRQPQASQRL